MSDAHFETVFYVIGAIAVAYVLSINTRDMPWWRIFAVNLARVFVGAAFAMRVIKMATNTAP